jgi:acyl transferase domain-containing protein
MLKFEQIPQRLLPWPEKDIRRASVNSFGYGGTNAHVILDAAETYLAFNTGVYREGTTTPSTDSGNGSSTARSSSDISHGDWIEIGEAGGVSMSKRTGSRPLKRHLIVLSHADEGGIVRLATDLKRHFSKVNPNHNHILESLAYTLSERRSKLCFRVATSATCLNDLLVSLESVSRGMILPRKALHDPRICFAFTGKMECFKNIPSPAYRILYRARCAMGWHGTRASQ